MRQVGQLSRWPLTVEAVTWTPTTVRTGGIPGPLHQEWRLLVRLACELPARAVVYLDAGGVRRHSRRWGRRAERAMELEVGFMPWDWGTSDDVRVSADEVVEVESAELKHDPVAATVMGVASGSVGSTGVPMTILTIPSVGVELGVLAVASTETTANRTSWRVRDEYVTGLGEFDFLAVGRTRGKLDIGQ